MPLLPLTFKGYMAIIEEMKARGSDAIQESSTTPFHVRKAPSNRSKVAARNLQKALTEAST